MIHPWHDVTPGDTLPQEFQTVVEIPFGSSVKYELDKVSALSNSTAFCIQRFIIPPTTDSSRRPWPRTTIRSTYWCFARKASSR